jgi:hypothetical protein
MRIIIRYTEIYGNSYTNALEFDERKLVFELVSIIAQFLTLKFNEVVLKTIIDNIEVILFSR